MAEEATPTPQSPCSPTPVVDDQTPLHDNLGPWHDEEANADFAMLDIPDGHEVDNVVVLGLDVDLSVRISLPTPATNHRKKLMIYSAISFHLGLYVGLVLYPIFSNIFRHLIK